MSFPYILVVTVTVFLLLYCWSWSRKSAGLPLPPGPRSLPFLGNVTDIDTVSPWRTYIGPIVSCRLIGQTVVIINSEKVARQLLDQRSAIYSGRPAGPVPKL
ncbi:hypothetical protein BD769DRAFT_1346864 [Suillus cothurnatus]|nr:hypothetical protein BD769DRAFT_1346864 [Suillus cothurnatus]